MYTQDVQRPTAGRRNEGVEAWGLYCREENKQISTQRDIQRHHHTKSNHNGP